MTDKGWSAMGGFDATERSRVAAFVARHPDPAKGYSAALWSLLQTAEFMNNH